MKPIHKRDVPAGAAITVLALVLLASVVTGREDERPAALVVEPASVPVQNASVEDLDIDRLKRPRKATPPPDLFASRTPTPAPAAAPVVAAAPAPAAPTAPALPFKYLGRMVDGGKEVVFLERNQDSLTAAAGDTLDNIYQVESISESAVQFVYLPLGTKQVLSVPARQ
jgi:hypothetical protein